MDDKIFDQVHDVDLEKTMKESYIEYAMSVIASRALPDVRDGLKPVQRRVLYSMIELNNGPDKPHRKCARIVGDTMGKYHPHGDSSIYGALVNMAQDWSFRYTLVDGHGNFGSVDGDGAAAMRYTEARLSKISMEMLADINKDTVDFQPNFDETEREPKVLPSRFPNLLVNGTTGIAVGMATNIPPHNLREVINAVVKIIDNTIEEQRETTIEELLDVVKGPDFPTGGVLLAGDGIREAYATGKGKVSLRAKVSIEKGRNGKTLLVITELPYEIRESAMLRKIESLRTTRKGLFAGISDVRSETDRSGIRAVIELKSGVNAEKVLDCLYKYSDLQISYGINMVASSYGKAWAIEYEDLDGMARAYCFASTNGDNATTMLSRRLEALQRFDCDGTIYHVNRSCKVMDCQMMEVQRQLSEMAGVPFTSFDGDQADYRNYSEAQFETRIQGLVEIMKQNKEAKRNG